MQVIVVKQAIEVKESAAEKRIESAFADCMDRIKANAEQGIAETELHVDKDIAFKVKVRLSKEVLNLHFMIVQTKMNEFTRRYDNYSGMVIGDLMYYKVKISK